MYLWIVLLVVLHNINVIISLSCSEYKTCGQCVGNIHHCVWCSDEIHDGPRCESRKILNTPRGKSWCKEAPVNPLTLQPVLKQNNPFSSSVQFRPQNIIIKARPGDTINFSMSYKPALDYPIDVYYIMDNSYTMSFHKKELTEQAKNIYNTLRKLSNNVRFGAGTFIEKPALPYADPNVGHVPDPFTNHLSLTENIEKFVKVVEAVEDSGNYDIPESGLDALMQAMVCDDINWRTEARRMIILATDAPYHSAGDGIRVGAYKPNDMKCHLNKTTQAYDIDASLLYDYPSVSQINKIATEKEISITFAVLKKVENEYIALADKIQGAKYVELKNNTGLNTESELANLIKDEYVRLAQSLVIDQGSVPSHLELKINPLCDKKYTCGVAKGMSFNLNASLHVKSCPSNNKYNDILQMGPFSLHEKLVVNVEVLCECPCEKKGKVQTNSPICHGSTFQCGICKCNKNRYGKDCTCIGNSTEEIEQQKCKAHSNETILCSGRGDCICGECYCSDAFEGKLCQFKVNDCPVYYNKICGGKGKCKFNLCNCTDGWTGNACDCSLKTDSCVGANSKVCSGNGACNCERCKCNNKYYGDFCELCDTCIEDRCKHLGGYVECIFKENKQTCDTKFDVKINHTVKILNQTEIKAPEWRAAHWCRKVLEDDSSILFKYLDGRNSTLILIQQEKELPPELNIWIPIGSAIGTILLIGLVTVIAWKVLTNVYDAREYKKFLKESEEAGYDVCHNALYQPPTMNIDNPAYNPKLIN